MASRPFVFHVSGSKVLIGALVTIVPISLVALWASTKAGSGATRAAGMTLQTVSESASSQIRARIRGKVVETALMASDSAVLSAVFESNRQYAGLSDEQIETRMLQRDELWNTSEGKQLVEKMMSGDASRALRRKLAIEPNFLRITVTDREGGTVAATHKTIDFYQADEDYWKDIHASGRGAVSLTDVLYDDATKHHYIGVGVPVVDEDNTFIGTLDALVDVSSLFPLVHREDIGPGGRMALVLADGTVIASSDGVTLADRARSAEWAAYLDAKASFEGFSAGSFQADFPNEGQVIIAFADTGLKGDYRKLDWHVVAGRPAAEAIGPLASVQFMIMLIALLSLACVVFVAVYFALHRRSEIEEIREDMQTSTA